MHYILFFTGLLFRIRMWRYWRHHNSFTLSKRPFFGRRKAAFFKVHGAYTSYITSGCYSIILWARSLSGKTSVCSTGSDAIGGKKNVCQNTESRQICGLMITWHEISKSRTDLSWKLPHLHITALFWHRLNFLWFLEWLRCWCWRYVSRIWILLQLYHCNTGMRRLTTISKLRNIPGLPIWTVCHLPRPKVI